jgi:hypothetical protein
MIKLGKGQLEMVAFAMLNARHFCGNEYEAGAEMLQEVTGKTMAELGEIDADRVIFDALMRANEIWDAKGGDDD